MNCIICGKELEKDEMNICKTCFDVLQIKYPNYKRFKEVLKWHQKQAKEMKRK